MEYTITQLAALAGVSTRTLRHYDAVGLLRPTGRTAGGYRLYGPDEVDRLQQILFYRELGLKLGAIAPLLDRPGFDALAALRAHKSELEHKRRQIDALLETVGRTIAAKEAKVQMKDSEKFYGFKESLIAENERRYGAEVRARHGDAVADASMETLRAMSEADFSTAQELEKKILRLLDEACSAGDSPGGARGKELALLHREWLGYHWPEYSAQAHRGLAELYLADERFTAYYDRGTAGRAGFLADAIRIHI